MGSAGPTTAFTAAAVLAVVSLVVLRLIPRPAS
jgi:hypothetical protein